MTRKNYLNLAFNYLILGLGAVVVLMPFVVMISTSLTPANEVFAWPPKLIPSKLMFSNYPTAIQAIDFGRYYLNSIIVTCTATITSLVLNSAAGYALAKLRFPGKKLAFLFILGTIMIPVQVTMIPVFIMFRKFPFVGGNNFFGQGGIGLIDSYLALILPNMATTMGIYLLREFFKSLPNELLQAARVDGSSEYRTFFEICLPLSGPGLIASGIFNFTNSWNDFLWPLIMTVTPKMRTIQLGLSQYQGQYFTDWHLMMAATLMSCLPILVLYCVFQKGFVAGISSTGIKG